MASTYAAAADLVAYVAGTAYKDRIPADEPGRTALLEKAELDLDAQAFPVLATDDTTGRKMLPSDLDPNEVSALKRATCAQAVYRVEMGDEFFVRAQRERVTGRSFSAEGKLPVLGPEASRELTGGGLHRRTTSTGRRRSDPDEEFRRW